MKSEFLIKNLGKVITGNTPSKLNREFYDSNDIHFIKPDLISYSTITKIYNSNEYLSEKARYKARIVPKHTVLVTCIGNIGKVGYVTLDEVAFNQQINAIITNDLVLPRYLAYALIANQKQLEAIANAPVVPLINKTQFENFSLSIHNDIEEQAKVINILDKLSNIIELKKVELNEYDQLIKSRFVEMFGDTKTNSKKLPLVKPEEICESISAGGDRPDEVSSIKTTDFAYPIFSNGEKDDGLYGWSKEYRIEKPSVTVSGRGTIGYSSYRKDGKFTPIVRLIVMTPNEKVNPVYLTYYLNLEREEGSGSGVQQLTVPMIKSKKIMLPELIKQNKFAEFVEQVDKLKFEVQKSLDESQTLFDSLMQEYFG